MPKVICTLENAADEISGYKFTALPDGAGKISEDLPEDVAAVFLSITGYKAEVAEAAKAPAAKEAQKPAAPARGAKKAAEPANTPAEPAPDASAASGADGSGQVGGSDSGTGSDETTF